MVFTKYSYFTVQINIARRFPEHNLLNHACLGSYVGYEGKDFLMRGSGILYVMSWSFNVVLQRGAFLHSRHRLIKPTA